MANHHLANITAEVSKKDIREIDQLVKDELINSRNQFIRDAINYLIAYHLEDTKTSGLI